MVRIATSSIHALIDTVRFASMQVSGARGSELAATLQDVLLGGVATKGVS